MRFFFDTLIISFVIIAIWLIAKYLYKRYVGVKQPYLFASISVIEKLEDGTQRIRFTIRKEDVLSIGLVAAEGATKSLLNERSFEPGEYHLDLNVEDLKKHNKLVFKSIDSYAERTL